MKRIVIDARELRTTSGRYVERLLHYLQEIDRTHEYSVLLKPEDMSGWTPTNPLFKKVVCPYKEFTFGEQLGLKRQVESLRANLVHFPFPQQPVQYKGKTVTTIHDLTTLRFSNPDKNILVFKLKQLVYAHVMKRVAKKSVFVITGSQFVKDDVVQFSHIDPEKVVVTHEAADPINEKPEPLPDLIKQKFIMYIGRPTPHKNLERLIAAFKLVRSEQPDLVLVLAGKMDSNYERLEKKVRQQTTPNIVFTDFVSEGQLKWLYEHCEAYLFPSLSEGFGLPGLEAMLHGAPVISSKATCLPEIYGDAAEYFDPLSTRSMANAINKVLGNKKLRADLIKKGRTQVTTYSWRSTAEQTLAVYKQALKET